MTKAAYLSFGLAALLFSPAAMLAQDNSAVGMAVHQSVLNQANTIVLRQKLADAQAVAQGGDIFNAAKLYQECVDLTQTIGSGIDAETAQAIAGLSSTSMVLARDAQSRGNLREADTRVKQVLRVDPKNPAALAFKKQNDQMLDAMKGHIADQATVDMLPQIKSDQINAGTLVQDGVILYEAGKFDDAEVKLKAALKLEPDNSGAFYYLKLIEQSRYARASQQHSVDMDQRMAQVEKQWVLPTSSTQLPSPNPYATNILIYTGPGRQTIVDKLNRIRLDNVNFDGLPLSEVLRQLSEQAKLRDPERKGINFLVNPNPDMSGQPIAGPNQQGGLGGGGGGNNFAAPVDPNTGLPSAGNAGGGEPIDINSADTVTLNLSDVRLADVLDDIVLVANHPAGHQLKYSIIDSGIVFSDKGAETPQLFMRVFKVDPNTFYSGLESVDAESFGSVQSSGGSGSGGGSSGSSQNQSSSIVGVVDAVPGASQARQSGGQGGGGGSSQTQGSDPLANGGLPGAGTTANSQGGIRNVSVVTLSATVSLAARNFFTTMGVNLQNPPGKSVFFNDRLGVLFVRATEDDLDVIERAIQTLNQIAPQVHIKSRFIEEQQTDANALGFNWYLGQFNVGGGVVGQGGSSGSLNVPVSAANPLGTFPGSTAASQVAASANDQVITSGLRNALGAPTIGTLTGILTNPNFQVALQALQQRTGVETLAEPEVVTTSGRQTQMRATQIITVISSFTFQQGTAATTTGTTQ